MTDADPPPLTPQVTTLRRLQNLFTLEQINQMATAAEGIKAGTGYGEFVVVFQHGRPAFITCCITERLEKT